ncbi:glycoside hydrolase [Maribacter sp. ANRC-HE7]|uniref:Glycoside hydrolase n=1 Tax=Maribacter aquimaris TaxID=2737171 RepID=A0ABR7V3U0_9FLAO|nr:glycoside hydrolase [Maribacter aquimaris]MBD0777813.1 glycoside hydrolase [Maribacter aquimaris]
MMKKLASFVIIGIMSIGFTYSQNAYSSWELYKYSGPGLQQTGWLNTKTSKEVKKSSLWSIGCETLDRNYADFNKYKEYVGELGVKRARLQSGWAKCETKKGVYNFEWLDVPVYGLVEQDIEPWISLSYGNPIYGSEITLGSKIFTDPKTMDAWLKYVEATVKRYKNVVKEWEVWNEPNGRNGSSEAYAELLIKTSEVIKKVQPDAKILGFSLSRIPLKWTEEVFEILKRNNKLELVDYLTYHPYNKNPDDSYESVEKLETLVHSYNPKIKLFQGENGSPSQLEYTHALAFYPWTEISQAKWFMRRMAGDRVRNIPCSIFTIVDLHYPNMLQSFGLLRANLLNDIIYKRPSYHGVQHMASFFDDSVIAVGELEYDSNSYRKLTVAGFKKENTSAVLAWYSDRIPDDELKWDIIHLDIKDTRFKDPVYVEVISGKVYEIAKSDWEVNGEDTKFKNLPMWDSPVMIAERQEVDLRTCLD